MAQWYACRCGFTFESGHSHHRGASRALCTECLRQFDLKSADPFGPRPGELLELLRADPPTKRKPRGPGRKRLKDKGAAALAAEAAKHTRVFVTCGADHTLGVDEIGCPECHRPALVLGFKDGEACPRCKTSTLSGEFVMY